MTSVFLASEAGSLITGETIVVDGGQYLIRGLAGTREIIQQVSRGYSLYYIIYLLFYLNTVSNLMTSNISRIEKESRSVGIPEKSKL